MFSCKLVMMLPSIEEIDVRGKRVLVRVDLNVEFDAKGNIWDAYRIEAVSPTISYLHEQGAKVILIAHLGDPLGEEERYSLRQLSPILRSILGFEPIFIEDFGSREGRARLLALEAGDVALLENIRFWPGEKANDAGLARALASLGDLYINDAFSVSHRAHTSVVALTEYMPSYGGLLFMKEYRGLGQVFARVEKPFTLIMGGAKSSLKLQLVRAFFEKADNILLGGILANALLQAQGLAVGKSRVDDATIEEVRHIPLTNIKLHLPVDVRVSRDGMETRTCAVGKVNDDEFIYDIGPETTKLFGRIIRESREIIWNGPMGVIESDEFSAGTESIARAIAESGAYSIVGGGESLFALHKFKLFTKISHISTAGGAMLEFLGGASLPGIVALERAAAVRR